MAKGVKGAKIVKALPESGTGGDGFYPKQDDSVGLKNAWNSVAEGRANEFYETMNNQIQRLQNDVVKMRADQKRENREMQKDFDAKQTRHLEVLAIFVAFFTFVSSTIQIFNRISDAVSAGLFLILIALLLCIFVVLIDWVVNREEAKNLIKKTAWVIGACIVIGLVAIISFVLSGTSLNPVQGTLQFDNDLEEQINKKIEIKISGTTTVLQVKTEIDILKKCLLDGYWKSCLQ